MNQPKLVFLFLIIFTVSPELVAEETPSILGLNRYIPPVISYLLFNGETSSEIDEFANVCDDWDGIFPENAYTVTEDDRLSLQALLDSHNVLRLSPGDYRTAGLEKITIGSNQAIVALLPTLFPDIEVSAGSNYVRLEGLQQLDINFQAGKPIRYGCFKNFRDATITIKDAKVEKNLFLALSQTDVDIDTSQNGYFSNNRFIKLNSQATASPLRLVGDAARLSGGNSFLLIDSQTPLYSGFYIEGQQDVSFFGVGMEGYNWRNQETEPYVFKVRNTGSFRTAIGTGSFTRIGDVSSPAFDIDADQVFLYRHAAPTSKPTIRLGPSTDFFFSWKNQLTVDTIQDDANAGLRLFAQEDIDGGYESDVSVQLGDTRLYQQPSNATTASLYNAITEVNSNTSPWKIPEFPAIADPTGQNWANSLGNKTDESDAIQAIIDQNDIAYLEPRNYYIAKPIILNKDQGIVGDGAGKTAIIAMTPDINMIELSWDGVPECGAITGRMILAGLTLQGGKNGIYSSQAGTQINRSVITHVNFRDMTNAGIFINGPYGWDNNVISHVNFLDSHYGVQQIGNSRPDDSCYERGEWASMSYMDKTVFFRNQFLRLNSAMELKPTRGNNLNAVVESAFVGNTENAMSLNNYNSRFVIASSNFIDNAGDPTINGYAHIVNSYFEGGRATSLLGSGISVEGSTFKPGTNSSATVFGLGTIGSRRNPRYFDLSNSILDIPLGPVDSEIPIAGLFFNNKMLGNDPFDNFFSLIEYITIDPASNNPTEDTSKHTRNVIHLFDGTPKPGSRSLRNADE